MEHKQFPEEGAEGILPEVLTDFPEQMEPLESHPEPVAEPEPFSAGVILAEEPAFSEEVLSADTVPAALEPDTDTAAFMDRIPDVEEDYPKVSAVESEIADALTLEILQDPEFAPAVQPEPAAEEIPDQEYRYNGQETQESDNAEAGNKDASLFQFPVRKGRPRRKKGEGFLGIPNILVTFVWLALIVSIGVTLGRMIWVCAADVLAFGREDKPVTITIYEADTMEDIIDKLHSNGLIRYKSLFTRYADISDAEEDIKPGIYDLNTRYDYHALVNFMTPRSSREVVEGVLIPEGYTCKQIFALLEENKICTAVDLAAYAANGELDDYWFLEDVQRGSENCLEGYLFPDTYRFYTNDNPRSALRKLLNGFEYRFTSRMQEKFEAMQKNGKVKLSMRQVIILASMIEKETSNRNESYDISAVYHNRLANSASFPYLDCDATTYYAIGDYFGTHGPLTYEDLSVKSDYNTSWRGGHTGLPIGPICNPGSNSIDAAIAPSDVNYFYYVYYPAAGKHLFAKTLNEHNANVSKVG